MICFIHIGKYGDGVLKRILCFHVFFTDNIISNNPSSAAGAELRIGKNYEALFKTGCFKKGRFKRRGGGKILLAAYC